MIIYFLYVVFNRIKYYLFALRFYIFIFLNFKSVNFIIKLFKNKNKNKKKTFTEYIRIRDVLFKEFLSKDYLSYAFVLRQFFWLKEFMLPFSYIKNLIFNGYYFNEIYNYYLYKNKKLSFNLMKNLDRGLIEYIGHLFIVNFINRILFIFSKKYPGRIDYFVFTIIIGIIYINILLIFWYILVEYKIVFLLLMLIFINILNRKDKWKPWKAFAVHLLVVWYDEKDPGQYYRKDDI